MPTEVILPKVDMDMATGQISRWFAKEGDTIRKGEPLFEIETDKAAMEVDAPASGILRDVTGVEGVDIAVGAPVAWIYAEGEAFEAGAPEAPKPAVVGPDPDVDVDAKAPDAVPTGMLPASTDAPPANGERRPLRATPLARRLARERGIDLSALAGRGPLGRIQREDVEEATETTAPAAVGACRQLEPKAAARAEPAPRLAVASSGDGAPLHLVSLREGTGTPIVLLHGFGSESASWRPLLAEIGEDIGPILGVDLAGHGASLESEAGDFAGLVAGVEDRLAAAGLSPCHLVGHSLGGAIAVAVAAGGTADVRSLLLLSPAGFGPEIDTSFTEGFARATEEAPVRSWLRHLVDDPASLSDGFVRATARGRADGRHAAAQTRLAARLFSNGTEHFSVRDRLDGLAMPVKIVAGTEDRVVPVHHFQGLPGLVALHLFPRTGHLPQMERGPEVARLLRQLVR